MPILEKKQNLIDSGLTRMTIESLNQLKSGKDQTKYINMHHHQKDPEHCCKVKNTKTKIK